MKKLLLILLLLPVFLNGQVTIIRKALPTTVFGSPIPFGSFILIESTNLVYSVKKLSGLKADSALVNYILDSDYQLLNKTDFMYGEPGTAQGQLAFWDATAAKWVHTETSEMVWDDVNKRFGIGKTAPGAKLDVTTTAIIGSGSGTGALTIGNVLANSGSKLTFLGYLNTYKNWQLGNGLPTGGVFSITPSTTNGGSTFTTPALSIDATGNVGIGLPAPTSVLHLKAGTTTLGPLGFTSGTLRTTPLAGVVEFDTDAWYGTITTESERKQFAFTSDITAAGHNPITLAAIGSTPNANGMTLSTQVLNLEPASASFGGVVTTGIQTFAGAKTFSSQVTSTLATGTSPFAVTSTTVNTNLNADLLDGHHWTDAVGLVTIPTTQVAYGNATSDGLTSDANLTRTSGLLTLTDGALLITGETGSTPVSGGGTRLMWIPEKAAFRVGSVGGTEWDAANIGEHSFVSGLESIASNNFTLAVGDGVTASGYTSSAIGTGILAQSYNVLAIGKHNVGGGSASTWVATDPIFEIGIGASAGARANAVTFFKNGQAHFYKSIHVDSSFYDSSGDQGTSGQVLSSTATGTNWIDGTGTGTVTEVTSATTNQLTVATGTTTPALTIVTGSIANGAQNLVISDVIFDALTVKLDNTDTLKLSGDISATWLANATGTTAIGDDKVTYRMLNDNVISEQPELTTGVEAVDEILISDASVAGQLKSMKFSVLSELGGFGANVTPAFNTGLVINDGTATGISAVKNIKYAAGLATVSGASAESTQAAFQAISYTTSADAAYTPTLGLARSKSATFGTVTSVVSGDALGAVVFSGAAGATGDLWGYGAKITAKATETFDTGSASHFGTELIFQTVINGATALADRLKISSAGVTTIYDVLQLNPIASPPGTASEGMIYMDTDHHLYVHNGTTWVQLDN